MKGLEEMKLVTKHPDGGRMITSAGRRDADRIASQVMTTYISAADIIDTDLVDTEVGIDADVGIDTDGVVTEE